MATVHDIACPSCDSVRTVEKRGIDRYYCTDCEEEFSISDL